MSDEEVQVKFGSELAGALAGINQLKDHLESIGGTVNSVIDSFKGLGEAALAAFAVQRVEQYIEKITALGEAIVIAKSTTGLGADEFQTLGFAMRLAGGDAEQAQSSIVRLERNIEQARNNAGPARDAFERLGVSLSDLRTKSPYELLLQLADGFKRSTDPIKAAADATEIGSRGFTRMLPLLKQGSEAIEALGKDFRQTGAYLNELQAEGFDATNDKLQVLQTAIQGTGVQLVRGFKPEIDLVITGLTGMVEAINRVLTALANMQTVMSGAVVQAFLLGIKTIQEWGVIAESVIEDVKLAWAALGRVIEDVKSGNLSAISGEFTRLGEEMRAVGEKESASLRAIKKEYDQLSASVYRAVAAQNDWIDASDKPTAGGGGGGSGSSLNSSLDDIATKQAIAKAHLAATMALMQEEAVYHGITKQEEVEQEKRAAEAEYAIALEALNAKLALYKAGSEEHAKTLNQMSVLQAQHVAKMAQLDVKMAQANVAATKQIQLGYAQLFDAIDQNLDTMLSGVLQGTQTWQEAQARVFSNMALSFIEAVSKMMLKWAAFQAAKVTLGAESSVTQNLGSLVPAALGGTASTVGSAANTAALTANTAALTTLLTALGLNTTTTLTAAQIDALCNVSTTANTAATTVNTAGQFAQIVPNTVSTAVNTGALAANTAAVSASSAGGGLLGGLLSFDVGTDYVPKTGLAKIHQGEIIIPPVQSQAIREGRASIGGGGPQVSIHLNTIDSRSGAQFLKDNAGVIAQTIAYEMRNHSSPISRAFKGAA